MERMNMAVAFLLLDAVAIALAVELGRASHRSDRLAAVSVRFFILIVIALFAALAAFSPLAALGLAWLFTRWDIQSSPT